jgi:NAD(P)-dependent dehydrogenase (short-subunit alcohol dehydrogenase family)
MSGEFRGKSVIVTGGLSGIGLATVRAFMLRGALVFMTGRSEERARTAIADLPNGPGTVEFLPLDVRDEANVASVFESIDGRTGGRLDVAVCNAGVNAPGYVPDISCEEFDRCIDTNLKGVFLVAREAITRMRSSGGGSVVTVSSNGGLIARAADPVYCASKAAVIMLTKAMAIAHGAENIRVNSVCPGPVGDTDMVARALAAAPDPARAAEEQLAAAPLARAAGRMIRSEEVAELIVFLCSENAAMVTGAAVPIDAGKSAGIRR